MKPKIALSCFLMFCGLLVFRPVCGQNRVQSAYERLLQTKKDYNASLATGDSAQIAEACYLLGKRYMAIDNYPKAQQWLLKSLRLRKQYGPSEYIGKIYLRLSESQHELHNLPNAKSYAKLAHDNFTAAAAQKGLIGSYRTLGDLERLTSHESADPEKALDSAAHCFEKALALAIALKDSLDMAITYESLGHLFILKKEVNASLGYYNEALKIYEHKGNFHNVSTLSARVSNHMLDVQNLPEAKVWLDRALLAGSQYKPNPKAQELVLATRALYEEKVRDWKNAFEHNAQLLALRIKNLDDTQQESMANVNLAYENELNLAAMAAEKKQNSLQKRLSLTLSILFAIAGIACFLLYLLFVKYRKASRENALLVKEQNHRTKNNLQSLTDLLSLQMYSLSDPGAIEAMEESLLRVQAMTLVHRSLYQGSELVYVGLQQYIPDLITMVLRTYDQEDISTDYRIDPILLHTDDAIILALIVSELTINACKYAFCEHPCPELHVSCKSLDNEIVFDFRDNGVGIPAGLSQQKGFGLDLIQTLTERLKGEIQFSNRDGYAISLSFKAAMKSVPINIADAFKVP